jgi:signal transduction histidine kinase
MRHQTWGASDRLLGSERRGGTLPFGSLAVSREDLFEYVTGDAAWARQRWMGTGVGIPQDDVVVCGHDVSFDHYARIVRRVLGVPVSVVSIVEPRRQVFAGASGLSEPYATTRETPLSHSFCKHVVWDSRPLVVSDARTDARVVGNLAITELDVIAYAGWPIVGVSGRAIGSLCAIDSEPRTWSDEDLGLLADLSQACSAELQQFEHQAVATENLTRAIFDSVDVAMAFYDVNDRLLLANDLAWRAADAVGCRLDVAPYVGNEVREADNERLIPPEDQLIPRALRGEQVSSTMHWIGPPGRQIAITGFSEAVLHADGTRWGTLITAHDVTHLARALQVKEDFIATVSHELRTPLTSIIGYLELVTDELDPGTGPIADALRVIDRNARNLQKRIGELVSTADRRGSLEVRSTDVSDLVHCVAATFAEQAKTANVMLTVEADEPRWADIDPVRVEQALENLVSNALKYNLPRGHVRCAVSSTPEAVQIVVEDTGVGMRADEVAQACELFWRGAATHRSAVQGLGVGLTFVRDTLEAHGGSIDITSQPGHGTTVTATLPRNLPRHPGQGPM